ncbi:hypothetical protein RHDC4_00915 [Rhodocyclaceae bacterium]|nr:hypothetical protein RHDC4_00915 [Rhodocyclaceae bacterium]
MKLRKIAVVLAAAAALLSAIGLATPRVYEPALCKIYG